MSNIFFSIIIATYNCPHELNKTLNSFLHISIKDKYEILIQDGSPSMDTVAVAENYSNLPIKVEHCQDIGIYDAWNKALQRASGEWVLFMGAGDIFCHKDSLLNVMKHLENIPKIYDYYAVPVEIVLPSYEFLNTISPSKKPIIDLKDGMCIPHQGLFHRRKLFKSNNYDIQYKIAGDYEFVCRTLTKNNFFPAKEPCVRMPVGGISSSLSFMSQREAEFIKISRHFYPKKIPTKLILRFIFWKCINTVSFIFGKKNACFLADIPRILQNKPRLWSRHHPPSPLSKLSHPPSIAICIATINRITELNRLLYSLTQQTVANFHIYLADQNVPGTLDPILRRYTELPITHIMLPPKGVSTARNALLSLIGDKEIIIFPDDDCWYAPDTLAQVAEAFQRHPQAGTVMGKSIDASPASPSCGQDAPVSQIGTFKHGETYLQFFRAEVVKDLRFDPRLGPGTGLPYGCGEDTDYLLEAHKRAPVWRCPSIRVFHPSPDTHVPSDAKIASYAAGRMYLLKKHAFPLWFRCANVLYPLCMLPLDALRKGRKAARYRWRMFVERLRHFSS